MLLMLLILPLPAGTDLREGTIPVITAGENRYVSLYDMVKYFPMEGSYDILLQRGKLYHKGHVAVYRTGHSCIIVDGDLCRDNYPLLRQKGDVLVPVYLSRCILASFYPDIEAGETSAGLSIRFRKKEDVPVKEEKKEPQYPIAFIIIDPGHGGRDPGAIGRGGLKEKHITLNVAKYLEAALKKKAGRTKIYMTRRNDRFIELSRRTEFANSKLKKNINGLFVSVHVNASVSTRISGFETYFLSQNPTNEDARNTAALENNVVVLEENGKNKKKYGDIDYIEARMITTQIQKESSMLARSIQRAMDRRINAFKSRGVRKADFYVLRGSLMPAVLLEVGFITNTVEARSLKKSSYQKLVAESIADGIAAFISQYNKTIR